MFSVYQGMFDKSLENTQTLSNHNLLLCEVFASALTLLQEDINFIYAILLTTEHAFREVVLKMS